MLVKDLFNILSTRKEEDAIIYEIALNPDCEVYKGHFPGLPITPGVCSVEIMKECAEDASGKSFMISNLQQCRFLNIITPSELPTAFVKVKISEKEGVWSLASSIYSSEKEYASMKAELKG